MVVSLFSTIPLLFCMGYFFMGSLPLLVLNHDTPLDSRFIRGFFNTYYLAVAAVATVTAAACAYAGQTFYAMGIAAIALLAVILRKVMLNRMDGLRTRITHGDGSAAISFRRLHIAGMVINFVQLVAVLWGMFQISQAAGSP